MWRITPINHHSVPVLFSLLLCACDPVTDRPDFGPITGAIIDTVPATPPSTIANLALALDSVGLAVNRESRRDGYLETTSFDVRTLREGSPNIYYLDRTVILRFWADQIPGDRTRITAEATYRKTSDPSLPLRLTETMAGRSHAGYELLLEIIRSTKERAGG